MNGGSGVIDRIERGGIAAWRGLQLYLFSVFAGLLTFCLLTTSISLLGIGIGVLLVPLMAAKAQWVTNLVRTWVGRWTGVVIERPHLASPKPKPGVNGWWEATSRILSDRATWRDLLWMLADPVVAAFTALLPAALIAEGVYGVLLASGLWVPIVDGDGTQWYTFVPVSDWPTAITAGVLGVLYATLGLLIAERQLHLHGLWTRVLLAPTDKSRLELRVQRLTETRSDAVDAQAAELRRIERDLHDGAQARLVAMGMSLGAIEHLLDHDPDKARLLLAEARQNSAKALGELRDLVRGIHPPVLADRGLADAIRALGLDHPLPVEVSAELPGRLEPPVESAAYFAVAELLTNVAKHAGAGRIWVDVRHDDGMLRISVTDDGGGGAAAGPGSGLRGIERRIGTFDGVLAISSPPGGPTIVTLELPCALSSPRISPS